MKVKNPAHSNLIPNIVSNLTVTHPDDNTVRITHPEGASHPDTVTVVGSDGKTLATFRGDGDYSTPRFSATEFCRSRGYNVSVANSTP